MLDIQTPSPAQYARCQGESGGGLFWLIQLFFRDHREPAVATPCSSEMSRSCTCWVLYGAGMGKDFPWVLQCHWEG